VWVPEKGEGVDILIGIVGFFAFAFLIVTVVAELTRTDALGWALTLLALVLVLASLLLIRRRVRAGGAKEPEDSHL
jgi:predicted RND superfamily exporter protein